MIAVSRLRKISGRYYWRPTRAVKGLGFHAEALGPDLAKAVTRAEELNAEVAKATAGEPSRQIGPGTMADIIATYEADSSFTRLAEATRRSYAKILREIEANAGDLPATEITRKELKTLYHKLRQRGLHTAAAQMRIWSILMNVAIDEGLRSDNPAQRLRVETPPSRDRRWTPTEVAAFCDAAVGAGRPSLRLAVLLSYRLAQREVDVLRLSRAAIRGGVVTLKQQKTDAAVAVPIDAGLRAAIEATPKELTMLVVSETTGLAYRADHFRHEFARIRKLAGLPADLRFADLRRTALTEAGDGGATVFELQAMSGHKTLQQLATYVRPTAGMARSAVRKRTEKQRQVAKVADRGEA